MAPTRVVDLDFNVVKQNTDMSKLSNVDADSRSVKCHEQLGGPLCQTEECPVKRLQGQNGADSIQAGDEDIIVREVDKELPDGGTKHMSMVAEPIMDETGQVVGIIESYKDMTDLEQARETRSQISVPEPRDEASFRKALTTLLKHAETNDVAFSDRSWKSGRVETGSQWDVEIATLYPERT